MNPRNDNRTDGVQEFDLMEAVAVLVKHRRMIAGNVVVVALITVLVSFLLPSYYTATTTLLPPDEDSSNQLQSLLGGSPVATLAQGSLTSSSDLLVQILRSRTLRVAVLQRKYEHDGREQTLIQAMRADGLEEALKELEEATTVTSTKEGIVRVSVELRSPQLSADVANTFIDQLDLINREKSTSRAKNSRIYIEEQLRITADKLAQASQELASFQEQHKAIALAEQTQAAIEQAGVIKGKILAKEVEQGVMLQTMKPDNPQVLRLQRELLELRKTYDHYQFGNSVPMGHEKDYFIPFAEVPEVGLELAGLVRRVKVQETVWELLNQQFYHAKIQEARDTPTIQVLDSAVPPEIRSWPSRKLLLILMTMMSMLFSCVWAYGLEYVDRVRERPEQHRGAYSIALALKSDYRALLRRIRRRQA